MTISRTTRRGLMLVAGLALLTLAGQQLATVLAAHEPSDSRLTTTLSGQRGSLRASTRLDRGRVLVGGDGQLRLELTLEADERSMVGGERTPTDFVVVLDRSGSMRGEKLRHARQAVHGVLDGLQPGDRFALVSYSSSASLALPLQPFERARLAAMHRMVDAIGANGGTNMSAGLDLALESLGRIPEAGRAARVLLISDGLANEGDSSAKGLARRADLLAGREAVLSTIGVGESFNELLMVRLADSGTGNYWYLNDSSVLADVLMAELQATQLTVAQAVRVSIHPKPGVEVLDAAGYPLRREGDRVSFEPGSLFAGQRRSVWVTLRVPTSEPSELAIGSLELSWSEGGERLALTVAEQMKVACVAERDSYLAGFDREAWERSVVQDGYSALKLEVAEQVRRGDKQAAERSIRQWREKNSQLNTTLASPAVEQALQESEVLASELDQAFSGERQAEKQNRLSKRQQAEGLDARRAGSKLGR